MRIEDAADCGSWMPAVEAHRYAICHEAGWPIMTVGRQLNLATLSAQTRDQSHQHGKCARYPCQGKYEASPTLCHIPHRPANSTERGGPRQVRRPELVDPRAYRHDEIENRHSPDPVFRGSAGASDGCQHPGCTADNRCE